MGVEPGPELLRAQVRRALAGDEQVGLGAGQHRVTAAERVDLKEPARLVVLHLQQFTRIEWRRECPPY